MPSLDDDTRGTVAAVFAGIGVDDVSVDVDGAVTLDEKATSTVLEALARVAAARELAFEAASITELIDADTRSVSISDAGFVAGPDTVVVPAERVLATVIELDLAARLSWFDDLDPVDALEEFRFLLVAADRLDVADLGVYVGAAAALYGAPVAA